MRTTQPFLCRTRQLRLPFFLIALALAGVAFMASADRSSAAERPNIIFIMTDDHASHALSCYGSKVNRTPNMDRLAAGGMRFANAFVTNSICSPSRATLLTGQYSHLNGVPVFNRFDGSRQTVARLLRASGYHTGMIGKWHLGSDPTGFDQWITLPGQGVYNNPRFITPHGTLNIEGYVSDVITDLGVRFIETRPADQPFFLMLHHKAPHRSWEPDEKNKALFKDRVIPEPETLNDDWATRPAALPENRQTVANDLTRFDLKLTPPADLTTPADRQKWLNVKPDRVDLPQSDGSVKTLAGGDLAKWKYQRYMQDYLACVQGVDDNIGRLLDYLDTSGLAKNTVVFYTSDNGFFLGDHGLYDKRFMYEASLRIPLLVRAPGLAAAGAVSDRMVLNVDFAPTFLDLAGLPVPADMQGHSLKPLLTGAPPDNWRASFYYRYYHDPGDHNTRAHLGLRTATEKLIHYWKKDTWEYYDLSTDPNELQNRITDPAAQPRIAGLKAELTRQQKELKDDNQFADSLPGEGVGGIAPNTPALGRKTVADAITAATAGGAAK